MRGANPSGQSHACASRSLMQTTQTIRVTSKPSLLVSCRLSACHSIWQTVRWQAPAPTGAQMPVYYFSLRSNLIMFFICSDPTKLYFPFSLRPNDASISLSSQTMCPSRDQTKLGGHLHTKAIRCYPASFSLHRVFQSISVLAT